MSQSSISGVVNDYTAIVELLFLDGSTVVNGVRVSSTADFGAGDTVMVYTPKGFIVRKNTVDPINEGSISNVDPLTYVGKYTFLLID